MRICVFCGASPGRTPAYAALAREVGAGLATRGIGVVYVSHRLPEVLTVSDRITVLRDGRSQGTFEASGMSENSAFMVTIRTPLPSPARGALLPFLP